MRDHDRVDRGSVEPIPTMTNDSTGRGPATGGSMTAESGANQILELVRPGMRVRDAAGEDLGRIDDVKMGDPGAATVGADAPAEPGFIEGIVGSVTGVGDEPAVPEPLRSRLLRTGYLKVDGKGWIDTDRYVTADRVGAVEGDTVWLNLNLAKDRLLAEDV